MNKAVSILTEGLEDKNGWAIAFVIFGSILLVLLIVLGAVATGLLFGGWAVGGFFILVLLLAVGICLAVYDDE